MCVCLAVCVWLDVCVWQNTAVCVAFWRGRERDLQDTCLLFAIQKPTGVKKDCEYPDGATTEGCSVCRLQTKLGRGSRRKGNLACRLEVASHAGAPSPGMVTGTEGKSYAVCAMYMLALVSAGRLLLSAQSSDASGVVHLRRCTCWSWS